MPLTLDERVARLEEVATELTQAVELLLEQGKADDPLFEAAKRFRTMIEAKRKALGRV